MADVQVAQKDLDDRGLRRLQPGDIIRVWVDKYYDVIESHAGDGYINDDPTKSMVKFDVTRRTKALPEGLWIRDQI